jgi:hypothetical protein
VGGWIDNQLLRRPHGDGYSFATVGTGGGFGGNGSGGGAGGGAGSGGDGFSGITIFIGIVLTGAVFRKLGKREQSRR